MSQFLNARFAHMHPYVPSEQPHDREYIKLNANEAPVPPSPHVLEVLNKPLVDGLRCYADPRARELRQVFADRAGVPVEWVFAANGSDEALAFTFMTCFHTDTPVVFPDVSYGFYQDYCGAFGVPFTKVPLREDWTVNVDALIAAHAHVVLANPNAPTGLVLPIAEIDRLCSSLPDRLVVIDEAYVDYGNPSCIPLVEKHANLVVVQTFSKSRNLAGAHIGFAVAQEPLISDMRDVKFDFNPFNISAVTAAIGIASVEDEDYFQARIAEIIETRDHAIAELRHMGFEVTDSRTNFVWAHRDDVDALEWNARLRSDGILARHFTGPRTSDWLRITVGTPDQMDAVLASTAAFLVHTGNC